ncbi:MAG: hypothetical protein WBE72_14450 [Terracidiphilus sp.]
MSQLGLIAAMVVLLAPMAGAAAGPWDQPAATLAARIADILGPGQARLILRNISSISTDDIPAVRRLLEQDLKARGVTASDVESANTVRITLSQNARQRLWVAEIVEGDETQVAMVDLPPDAPARTPVMGGLLLRRVAVFTASEPILAALESVNSLVVLGPQQIAIYVHAAGGWQEQKRVNTGESTPLVRDPRGMVLESADGSGFEARLAGMRCSGSESAAGAAGDWTVQCGASDDPWNIVPRAIEQPSGQVNTPAAVDSNSPALKAFYNAARNYFTGVVSPSLDVDLPAFYSAALVPRSAGNAALLIDGVDGKVQLVENGALSPVAGARDWGSDLAVLRSGCGAGAQIVVSGSGEAASDSLRAYELPALEALPVSAPLPMDGTVTAIWPGPDSKSVYAVVRTSTNQYEVDRVSAMCN